MADFNVDNYTVKELLNILGLGLDDVKGPSGEIAVENECRKYIAQYSGSGNRVIASSTVQHQGGGSSTEDPHAQEVSPQIAPGGKPNYVNFFIETREKLLHFIEGENYESETPKLQWKPSNPQPNYSGDQWLWPKRTDGAILSQDGAEYQSRAFVIAQASGRSILKAAPKQLTKIEVENYIPGVLNPRKITTYFIDIDIDSNAIQYDTSVETEVSHCPVIKNLNEEEAVRAAAAAAAEVRERHSNFLFEADTTIQKAISLELLYYDIPFSWHEFTEDYGTNSFRVIWDKMTEANNSLKVKWWNFDKKNRGIGSVYYESGDVSGTIEIPEGNYTLDDLFAKLNEQKHIIFEKDDDAAAWIDNNGESQNHSKIKIRRIKEHKITVTTDDESRRRTVTIRTDVDLSGAMTDLHNQLSGLVDISYDGTKITIVQSGDDANTYLSFYRADTAGKLGLTGDTLVRGGITGTPNWIDNEYFDEEVLSINFSNYETAFCLGFDTTQLVESYNYTGKYTIITEESGLIGDTRFAFDVLGSKTPVIMKEGKHHVHSEDSVNQIFIYNPDEIYIKMNSVSDKLEIKKKISHVIRFKSSETSFNISLPYDDRSTSEFGFIVNGDAMAKHLDQVSDAKDIITYAEFADGKYTFNLDVSYNLEFNEIETARFFGFDDTEVPNNGGVIVSKNHVDNNENFQYNVKRSVDFRDDVTAISLGFSSKIDSDGEAYSSNALPFEVKYIPKYSISVTNGNKTSSDFVDEMNGKLKEIDDNLTIKIEEAGSSLGKCTIQNDRDNSANFFTLTFDSSMNSDLLGFADDVLGGSNVYISSEDVLQTYIPWEKKNYIGAVRYEEVEISSGNYQVGGVAGSTNLIETLNASANEVNISFNKSKIIITDPSNFQFKLIFHDSNSDDNKCGKSGAKIDYNLGKIMGFQNNIYYDESTYKSENDCDIKGRTTRYLYLSINDFNNSKRSMTKVTHSAIRDKIKLPTYAVTKCVNNENKWIHRLTGNDLTAAQQASVNAALSTSDLSSQNRYYNTKPPADIFGTIYIGDEDPTLSPHLRYKAGDKLFTKRQYFGPVDIKRLKVEIYNDKGQIIDLRGGSSVLLQLRAECLYQL